jgi:hypothetical protein
MSHHVWTLIGPHKSRKESTIRALTGVARGNDIEVRLANGQTMPLWTQVCAINEMENAPDAVAWAETLKTDQLNSGPHVRLNLLLSFRIDPELSPAYAPEAYLEQMVAGGCTIESIITLGQPTPGWVCGFGSPFADIRDVGIPTNAIAAQIRKLWGWA